MATTEEALEKARQSWVVRRLFRMPPRLYRLGLAARLGKAFLLLTTTGRQTGRPHTVGLDFVEEGERIYVFVGYGRRTDWYRNLLAQPEVMVQIGNQHLRGRARPIDDVAERRRLLGLLRYQHRRGTHGPPRAVRWLMKRLGIFDYDAALDRSVVEAEHVPAVEITPAPVRYA